VSVCIVAKPELFATEVVACCDRKVSTDSVSSETGFKFRPLSPHWLALWAGVNPVLTEVLDLYEVSPPNTRDRHPVELLRRPLRVWRKRLAEACIHEKHALSFDEFYKNGKVWLDLDVWTETQREIARRYDTQKTEVQLILIGNVGGSAGIYVVSCGEVTECAQVATIGTGYAVAEAALYWRMDHDSPRSLDQTIYSVYEAKKLSEMSPFVGEKSTMAIIRPGDSGLAFESVDIKILEKEFKRFGPKPYRRTPRGTRDYLRVTPITLTGRAEE
jgi:hypothetical protein